MDITQLYNVATDAEASMLDDLRIRAGWIWRCPECDWFNKADFAFCDNCSTKRP